MTSGIADDIAGGITNPAESPAALGYRMPAEWHRHAATWLTWPKDPVTWPDRVAQVQTIFVRMMELLAEHEVVDLLVDDEATQQAVRQRLTWPQASNVRVHVVPTVDSWIRDYGPNFLVRSGSGAVRAGSRAQERGGRGAQAREGSDAQEREGIAAQEPEGRAQENARVAYNHWGFNAWGGKYETLMADARVPTLLAPLLEGMTRFEPGLILEGGSIDVNGAGIVLTTEQCLLNQNRNPQMGRLGIERALREYLGVHQVLWLGEGVAGDDTDGHIDDIARFVSAETIVCALEEDPADANYHPLQDNLQRLKLARDSSGRPFRIVTLPMPGPVLAGGEPLPASYANFYIANGVVLLPVYGHANDRRAVDVLQPLFPDRPVVPINCEPLVWGMGAIHCVTQQQPAA
jgi:agmatine deiminase